MADDQRTAGVLDVLVERVLGTYPYEFTVAETADERAVAYRMRFESVVDAGWMRPQDLGDGLERDEFDDAAIQVIGRLGGEPVCTGRLVLPPRRLPTEQACGLVVEPGGRVVDVGRMAVARAHQDHQHAAFVALLCRLYLEMRTQGFEVACGMMSPRVRALLRRFGLRLQQLQPDREYWGEQRAPVRFALTVNAVDLLDRWAGSDADDVPRVAATGGERRGRPGRGSR